MAPACGKKSCVFCHLEVTAAGGEAAHSSCKDNLTLRRRLRDACHMTLRCPYDPKCPSSGL